MTNKTTKRALLASIVSLVLCFSMLLGTTYAWFTDSAVSGRNTIRSGNLDVVLEYKTSVNGTWAPVTENTKLFKEGALYEPGYTEIVFLRVSNAGSLALKYNLNVNVYGETTSTNVNNQPFSLKDHLEIGYYLQDESMGQYLLGTQFGTREAAIDSVKSQNGSGFSKLSAYNGIVCKDAPLVASTTTNYSPLLIAIVLTMPTTVGNEANHKTGVDAPTIDLGVTLVATQFTDENDSFGNQYDKDAEYPELIPTITDLAGLREAMANGGEYKLGATINVASTELLYNADGGHSDGSAFLIKADMVLDLNGYDIVVDAPSYASDVFFVNGGHNFTVKGDGTVTGDCGIFVAYDSATTINIEGGNYKCTANNDMLYAIWGKLNVSGGTYETAYWNLINIYGQGNISLVDVSGGSFKNWNPAASPDGNLLADGYKVTSEVIDGATWYTVVAE